MKQSPRDLLLKRHHDAEPMLDEIRQTVIEELNAPARHRPPESVSPSFFAILCQRISALLWPCPRAWAGLAAVWVAIFVVNAAGSESQSGKVAHRPPPSPEVRVVLQAQERLMAELLGTAEPEPAEPPRPGPRSERRREVAIA